jgi:hypothetical protein
LAAWREGSSVKAVRSNDFGANFDLATPEYACYSARRVRDDGRVAVAAYEAAYRDALRR